MKLPFSLLSSEYHRQYANALDAAVESRPVEFWDATTHKWWPETRPTSEWSLTPHRTTPQSGSLRWTEDTDDDGNSFWEAPSPFGDGADGDILDPFYFRLKQHLVENSIQWYEASDAEAMRDEGNPRGWATLEEAKAAIQKDDDEIREQLAKEGK